jgi:replication factor A2
MPMTVKQIEDAQLAGAGEDGVETANVRTLLPASLSVFGRDWVTDMGWVGGVQIRVVGTVSGKAERATDVCFTLDDGTGRIDFIRW